MENSIKKFVALSKIQYHSMPSSDEHEMEHNYGHKKSWGRVGINALKEVAEKVDGVAIKIGHNKSGSIDRGYVSGFINNVAGNKTVYVSINDGMNDILFRTAKHPTDYTGGPNNTAPISQDGFERVRKFICSYFCNADVADVNGNHVCSCK